MMLTFFTRISHPGVSHMICTKRAQAGFPELSPNAHQINTVDFEFVPCEQRFLFGSIYVWSRSRRYHSRSWVVYVTEWKRWW